MKLVQTFLARANSLEDLDKALDEFLQDKNPEDIITTDLAITNSPYDQMQSVYTAMIIYRGLSKKDLILNLETKGVIKGKKPFIHKLVMFLAYTLISTCIAMLYTFITKPSVFNLPAIDFVKHIANVTFYIIIVIYLYIMYKMINHFK